MTQFNLQILNQDDMQGKFVIEPLPQGYGHTIGIKEILEIPPGSGNIYYKRFAGSDPAQDAVIYNDLISKQELIAQLKSKQAVILTWSKK